MRFRLCLPLIFFTILQISCEEEEIEVAEDTSAEQTEKVEKIYNGNVFIRSQAELDEFMSEKYTRVNGSFTLLGDDIVNIEDLNTLTYINGGNGTLYISSTSLNNLDGFKNVNLSSDMSIVINDNNILENLNGLQNLSNKVFNLQIHYNESLTNIDGLKNIPSVENNLLLEANHSLKNIDGLIGLENSVFQLYIKINPQLENISGLSGISQIEYLDITNNISLKTIDGLIGLTELTYLTLVGNDTLLDIDGLNNLTTCWQLSIINNSALSNLDGLQQFKNSGDTFTISHNSSLRDFCGLSLLATVKTGGYSIRDNAYNPSFEDISNGNCNI